VPVVDDSGDTADRYSIPLGKIEVALGMVEERVLQGQESADITLERRHPVRIVPVDRPGKIDELLQSAAGFSVYNTDCHRAIPDSRFQVSKRRSIKKEQIIFTVAAFLWNMEFEIWNSG